MERLLFENAQIMDGTGLPGYRGNVLIGDGKILAVSKTPIAAECEKLDCEGLALAPGFIDAHSHHDLDTYYADDMSMNEPFLRQGITTYVAGNCGFSPAGMWPQSPYRNEIMAWKAEGDAPWNTYGEYFDFLRKKGMRANMAMLAGHGFALASVVGNTPAPGHTAPDDMKKVRAALEEGLDSGCKGISFGLGYRPSSFIPDEEVREAAQWAINRHKLVAVHERIMTAHAPQLYGDDYSVPHNLRWHREFLERFRDSGARLQLSHLLTVGRAAFPTFGPMMELIDEMMGAGMDLWFDMYSYVEGGTTISIRMPNFFYDNLPRIYEDKSLWDKLEEATVEKNHGIGILPSDVLLAEPYDEGLREYIGLTMDKIAASRRQTVSQWYMELYRRSNGFAKIYFTVEQKEENIPEQMRHPRALYMTDAWVEPEKGCLQNACAYGAMPKFLRLSREHAKQSMEETVAKMTGRTAARFDLYGRGLIKEGYAADITIFDPATVAEVATPQDPERFPVGIAHVFINGKHILNQGKLDTDAKAGSLLV
jgi:N-acyl-D-aspartate/D-glutamate deacylase